MIEMQMRDDQMRDVAGFHPERAQMIRQPAVAMIENPALDIAQPVADSSIDQHGVGTFHDKRTREVQADAIALVGRMVALPQLARDDAEHASAVVAPQAVGQECDLEGADVYLRRCLSHLAFQPSSFPLAKFRESARYHPSPRSRRVP